MLVEEHIKGPEPGEAPVEMEAATSSSNQQRRSCIDCHTTSTPCWRGGPAGPRTLCNACGIRYRKRRRAIMGLRDGEVARKSGKKKAMKVGWMGFDKDAILQREWKRKMGEEERAAILLMALSCGSVFA